MRKNQIRINNERRILAAAVKIFAGYGYQGASMRKIAEDLTNAGADVKLCMVLVNKSWDDDVGGFPLRALVRAATV